MPLMFHEPKWEPAQLMVDDDCNTEPGFRCTHELENGNGQCEGTVFAIEDSVGQHCCWVAPEL